MDHIYPKTLFIVYLNIFSRTSLFVDCVFANSPTLLKGICNLKINTHSSFSIIHRTAKKLSWLDACSQLRLNKWCPAFLFQLSYHTQCSLGGLCSARYFAFLLAILLFNMAPKYRVKCCLVFLTER